MAGSSFMNHTEFTADKEFPESQRGGFDFEFTKRNEMLKEGGMPPPRAHKTVCSLLLHCLLIIIIALVSSINISIFSCFPACARKVYFLFQLSSKDLFQDLPHHAINFLKKIY
jgi:hypothetical protein